MSDDNTNDKKEEKQDFSALAQKSAAKLAVIKEINTKLNNDSKWNVAQLLMQEVAATYITQDPTKPLPSINTLIENLKVHIKQTYSHDEELCSMILESIPTYNSVTKWFKKEGWDDAVWDKIKDTGLFTSGRRAAMINALYKRGLEKDTVAAKLYLQMSGDFVEKSEVTNKDSTIEKYREINQILHKKKENE